MLDGLHIHRAGYPPLLTHIFPCVSPLGVSIADGVKGGWIRFNPSLYRLEVRTPVCENTGARVLNAGDVGLYAYYTQQATRPFLHAGTQCVTWKWVCIEDLLNLR